MQVVDLYESSAILVCPQCRGPYIVSGALDRRGFRKCPHCNSANEITYEDALAEFNSQSKTRKHSK